jgi:hypothetical protein
MLDTLRFHSVRRTAEQVETNALQKETSLFVLGETLPLRTPLTNGELRIVPHFIT